MISDKLKAIIERHRKAISKLTFDDFAPLEPETVADKNYREFLSGEWFKDDETLKALKGESKMLYAVTDPCYLLNDSAEDNKIWDDYCFASFRKESGRNEANQILAEYLQTDIWTEDTGYGDWSNSMSCTKGKDPIKHTGFCADSGQVCLVRLTDKLQELIKTRGVSGYALFETDEPLDSSNITFDKSNPEWTVVRIKGVYQGEPFMIRSCEE